MGFSADYVKYHTAPLNLEPDGRTKRDSIREIKNESWKTLILIERKERPSLVHKLGQMLYIHIPYAHRSTHTTHDHTRAVALFDLCYFGPTAY